MQCLKCGRDVKSGEVFCEVCHQDMEQYPVKPGTVVLLPQYTQYSQPKRIPVRIIPPEEQIRNLKKRNKFLGWSLAVAVVLAAAVSWAAINLYLENDKKFLPGQNYSSVNSKTETEPSETPDITGWD